jgi:hypothetical protein
MDAVSSSSALVMFMLASSEWGENIFLQGFGQSGWLML